MRFTEFMNVFGIDSAPHAQLRAITWQEAGTRVCPDPSRVERARGEDARQIIVEALELTDSFEWLDIVTPCGQEAVVEYIRRVDPVNTPAPVIVEEQRKRRIKIEK